ncbi:MAG: pyridoxamine 5'-phosphate oxidase family protein [Anaerolineae bacterium]
MSWQDLETGNPDLAAFGAERFRRFGVAYLATIRPDGAPRVHPVTPIVGHGRLFLFMEPTSPKGHDLRRDGRYALHSAVSDSSGESGEFFVSGQATFRPDAETRQLAAQAATYTPAARYILFELDVDSAASTVYGDGRPVRQRWQAR